MSELAGSATGVGSLEKKETVTITGVRTTVVNIPLQSPYRWSVGVYPGFTRTIVEVETSNGAVGIGEASDGHASVLIGEAIAPRLIGADPYDLADCEQRCVPPFYVARNVDGDAVLRAYGGVEIALWDLIGKLDGRPLYQLLGGRVRDQVPVSEYFARRVGIEDTPNDVANYCARMVAEHDARCLEGKVGTGDLATDVKMVREIRSAVGEEIPLRLDANMAWTLPVARDALHRLAPFNIRSIEEPVRTLEQQALLRPSTPIAFSSHDPDVARAVRLGVPDAFVINLTVLGGIRRTVEFIAACRHMGIAVWFYSPDAGIATAANLHVSAAIDWICEPSQTLMPWQTDDVTAEGPLRPQSGVLPVPKGPGLGVTLDRAALKRCHRRYRDDGPYTQYADMNSRPGYRSLL